MPPPWLTISIVKLGAAIPYEIIAALLSVNACTVGRGITKLIKIDFFKMATHGGSISATRIAGNKVVSRHFDQEG